MHKPHSPVRPGLWPYGGTAWLLLLIFPLLLNAAPQTLEPFDDKPLDEALSLPDWFKLSFLDIREDIEDAKQGKRGLIIYYGQKYCPYCKAHLQNNWGDKSIIAYTRANFDVIAIDIRGNRTVTTLNGKEISERDFAIQQKANFTPALQFYDRKGKLALKITGYRQPYQFKAALEYVADLHHEKESFPQYYARAEKAYSFGSDKLNEMAQFNAPLQAGRPGVVFYEHSSCHACDVLHGGPLLNKEIQQRLAQLNVRQVDIQSDAPVQALDGKNLSGKQRARQLQLDYAPTLIFYDPQGKEIIRIDAVVWFFRLRNVLDYVTGGAYQRYPDFQEWRYRNTPQP
ncbi:MAG: thioredoxin fold domain-containing protein [Gammaproteobacteria bacterium]|nr:thioredoxin fold domain-containing protein [Gammaproteobacteria bacterium]MDH5650265.1 thioredoxin fold domain-containing protein [Gammaproteobacteria bacterium]